MPVQTVDNADRDFLASIQRSQPVTVADLCEAEGVTATAVRQRLTRLLDNGFIERESEHRDRGRPVFHYSVTKKGLRQLGNDSGELAGLLWRALSRIEDEQIRDQVLADLREALVARFGGRVNESSLGGRLQQLCDILAERGYYVDLEENPQQSLPILREHSCPYQELAEQDSAICDLEQSVFAELLGAPVELSCCRLDGHRCCEFQVGVSE